MENLIEKIKRFLESLMSFKKEEDSITVTKDETPTPDEVHFSDDYESQNQAEDLLESEKNYSVAVEHNENIDVNFGETDKGDIRSAINVEKSKAEEAIGPSSQEVEEKRTLLENEAFVKLVEECVDTMKEFDGYINRLESDESKMIIELIIKRIHELLERAGLDRIDDVNTPFSVLLHLPVPLEPVMEGVPVRKILQTGLILDNRVFVKAKVEI